MPENNKGHEGNKEKWLGAGAGNGGVGEGSTVPRKAGREGITGIEFKPQRREAVDRGNSWRKGVPGRWIGVQRPRSVSPSGVRLRNSRR